MPPNLHRLIVLASIIALTACTGKHQPPTPTATSAPSAAPPPTFTLTATIDATAIEGIRQTNDASAAQSTLATETAALLAEAGSRATNFAATKTQGQSDRQSRQETQQPKNTQWAQNAGASATEEAGAFLERIRMLHSEGIVGSAEGEYYSLPTFRRDEAQINYLFYEDSEYSADNFVLETDLRWESASMTADWPTSGCGFVIGQDHEEYLFTFLGLDGLVQTAHHLDRNTWRPLADIQWGPPDLPIGMARFLIAVWDKRITFYIDEAPLGSSYDGAYQFGIINYAVVSGTNKDFGTRCTFNNTKLFIFE